MADIQNEHRLTAVEDRSKSNTHRIEELEKRQDNLDDLVTTVKVLATREENVENDVKEIKADVKTMAAQPAKRWNGVIDKIIGALVGGIIAYLLVKLGLG